MANNIIYGATAGIGQLLSFLKEIHGDVGEAKALINLMGWELPPGVDDIGLATIDLGDFLEKLDAVVGASDEEWEDEIAVVGRIADLTVAINALVQTIRALADELPTKLASFGDYVDRTQIHKQLPRRLFDFLLINYLAQKTPIGFAVLNLMNVIDYPHFEADPENFQVEHVRATVNYHLFKTLVTDPAALAEEAYGWGTPQFAVMIFLRRLSQLFQTLGLRSRIQPLDRRAEEVWLETIPSETEPIPQLITFVHEERGNIAGLRLGFSVFGARPTSEGASDGGLGFAPIVRGEVKASIPFFRFDDTFIDISAAGDLLKRLAMILRPNEDLQVRAGGGVSEAITGRVALTLRHGAPDGAPKTLLNFFRGSGLRAQQISLTGGMDKQPNRPAVSFLELALLGGRLDFSLDDADGFLQDAVTQKQVGAPFDLRIGWTSERGIYFEGGTGLTVTLPVHAKLGPFGLNSLILGLNVADEGLSFESSVDGSLSLGPLLATVERLGVQVDVLFGDGNLGIFGLSPRFKPPTGLGLAIDASVVVGGGFLRFDPGKGEYSGILQLEIAEKIAVKAIGLLTTRMPDGAKGYSLMVIIFAEGFAPIQLGYGFTLTGIGGLLAINRTFDEAALRAGLKNHTLDSVMFPHDPIRNAPQILSNLNKVFPPANGHHLFGPMVQISWGTPALITADLAVVLEFGARLRLLILAQVVAILPKRENDLVRLQMDAIGVIDFDQGTAALDATLYDSRLLKKFVLTGDMAMRMKWEGSPNFALAVGGLHPAFNPPANFPKLQRIAINLSSGDNPRIRCEAYFALTANTVQFGARAELYASASGFSIHGGIGFDVLIQLDPFQFLAEFYAQVQLKRGSSNLFKVKVQGALAGPRPLHVKAKATFEILWWDVSVRVDKTLVGGEKPPLPEPIDVLPRLKEALGNPGNWVAELPAGQRPMVTLREKPRAANEVLLHPLGTLTVKQSIVPLDIDISRFGQAAPAGARRFTISSVSLGEPSQTTRPVKEFFAPAQFFEMSDDEKLSRPSFEPMAAGMSIGSEEFAFTSDADDWLEVDTIKFETIIMNKEKKESRRDPKNLYALSAELFGKQARFGAAGAAAIRRSGTAKYRSVVGKHRIAREGWSIVATQDLTVQPLPGIEGEKPASYSEAVQGLRKLQQENPVKAAGLKILRLSEVAGN
jgi:hypothetical protein